MKYWFPLFASKCVVRNKFYLSYYSDEKLYYIGNSFHLNVEQVLISEG